ncbi:MAG: membrane protein insertion efficiency factor YidD [Bacteroidota bacterium]
MKSVVLVFLRAYQILVSPIFPPNTCRFYPSCSTYAVDAVRKYGPWKGMWRAARRVGRCHPFHPGGYDPA